MNTSFIDSSPFSPAADGIRVRVLAHPGARRDSVEGLRPMASGRAGKGADGGMALRVAVRAAPEDGKANAAIIALLAREWRVPQRSLRLVSGSSDRRKSFHLAGEPKALLARLQSWLRQQTERS
ncbi:MAG TPA: DUF167 family protein [Candidatus Polarisedimenticolia bacterium]|nr:DUF167 family protein [Candidatus Polarisedimenticolia bacterium]